MSVPIAAMHSVTKAGDNSVQAPNEASNANGEAKGQHRGRHVELPDSRMTPNELQRIAEVFRELETGPGQGSIFPKDLSTAMKMLGLNPTESEIQDLINEIEHNGLISFRSFCLVVVRKMRDDDEENFHKELFRAFVGPKPVPSNQAAIGRRQISGELLSLEQFKDVMMQLPEPVTEEEAEEMFAVADRDTNGRISFGEFRRMCLVSRCEVVPDLPPSPSVSRAMEDAWESSTWSHH